MYLNNAYFFDFFFQCQDIVFEFKVVLDKKLFIIDMHARRNILIIFANSIDIGSED